MEELEILDNLEMALSHCIMAVELMISDCVQYKKADAETIEANHKFVEELKGKCRTASSLIVEKVRNTSTQEAVVDYIETILTHCQLYNRLHNKSDKEFLNRIRGDYQSAPWYKLAMYEYQIAEYEGILKAGKAIAEGNVSDNEVFQNIVNIFQCYEALGCDIDAALLLRGADFIRLQEGCGIWIYQERDYVELIERVGSAKKMLNLLNKVAKADSKPKQEENTLPSELNTPNAQKYFSKARELGFIEKTSTGFKWVSERRGALAQLAYFCSRVFCPNNTEILPESALNQLFGVSRIGAALSQINNAQKPQKWRSVIDSIFED